MREQRVTPCCIIAAMLKETQRQLFDVAQQVAKLLSDTGQRIVLAESCTAGMVSAALGMIPGISNHLCGSSVTYREETKMRWLGISADLLQAKSAVSREVTEAMAVAVLQRTPEAHCSAAITGHLGPNCASKSRRPSSHRLCSPRKRVVRRRSSVGLAFECDRSPRAPTRGNTSCLAVRRETPATTINLAPSL